MPSNVWNILDKAYWRHQGFIDLKERLALEPNKNKAKNVILFIGDGMGVQTHTAARIYKGQKNGKSGEEEILEWEKFPYSGQSKTYTTDYQVPDSAATATALFTGTYHIVLVFKTQVTQCVQLCLCQRRD